MQFTVPMKRTFSTGKHQTLDTVLKTVCDTLRIRKKKAIKESIMAKSKRKRPASAVLKLMSDPMFRQRREKLKTLYNRKEKHNRRSDSKSYQKALSESVLSRAA